MDNTFLTRKGPGQATAKYVILVDIQTTIKPLLDDTKEYDYDQLPPGKLLGHGSFAVVHLVELEGKKIAVKHFLPTMNSEMEVMYFSKGILYFIHCC